MRNIIWVLALAGGCIEYTPSSTLPAQGVPNDRPLEVETKTDKLVQVQTPEVDILWVVDNSGSMSEEQAAIAQNFPIFMDFFLGSGLDYHIGVTSTDTFVANGDLREVSGVRWIEESTPNPTTVFGSMAQMGISGSATERGRDPVYQAIEVKSGPGGFNEGFYREQATINVIVISDEEDQSLSSRSEFISWFDSLKLDPDHNTFSSIVTPNLAAYGSCPGGVVEGAEYIAVTQAVGGILWPICNPEWDEVLEQLGIQASGLKREYFLSELPVPGSIKVWVMEDGTRQNFEEDIDYTYDQTRNSILFTEFVPNALSEVFVKYEKLGASEG